MAVRAAAHSHPPAVVAVDTAVDTAVVVDIVVGTAVVVVAVVSASLAVSGNSGMTGYQKQPERHNWGIDTTAASQPHVCYITA